MGDLEKKIVETAEKYGFEANNVLQFFKIVSGAAGKDWDDTRTLKEFKDMFNFAQVNQYKNLPTEEKELGVFLQHWERKIKGLS